MSKGRPTPKRPRQTPPKRRLDPRERTKRFVSVTGIIILTMSLGITGFAGAQGFLAGDESPTSPELQSPLPSPSPSDSVDPQLALRLQAAAAAIYLEQAIQLDDTRVNPNTTALPASLSNGEEAPELVVPVSVRITKGEKKGERVVCARASSAGTSAVRDEYFILPTDYEGEEVVRCPEERPSTPISIVP